MADAASDAGSDATKGSNHSSAIMIIPEPWEYLHAPLSRMRSLEDRPGTPVEGSASHEGEYRSCVNRPGTPFGRAENPLDKAETFSSGNTIRTRSRDQVALCQNTPEQLSTSGNTDDEPAPSQASHGSSRQYNENVRSAMRWLEDRRARRASEHDANVRNVTRWLEERQGLPASEHDENAINVIRWFKERRALRESHQSQDFGSSGERRSSSGWVGPAALFAAVALASGVGRINNQSRSTGRDHDEGQRHSGR